MALARPGAQCKRSRWAIVRAHGNRGRARCQGLAGCRRAGPGAEAEPGPTDACPAHGVRRRGRPREERDCRGQCQ
eukprot:15457798-Alexandrium_andersonii.AAC.1